MSKHDQPQAGMSHLQDLPQGSPLSHTHSHTSLLDGIALTLPATRRATLLQNRAAQAGFD